MASSDSNFVQELAEEHRRWLSQFDKRHLQQWNASYKSDPEGALGEAAARRILESHDVVIEPNEDLHANGSGPDFRCHVGGIVFYAEVTCIQHSTATKWSGLSELPTACVTVDPFGMGGAIARECVGKAKQCSDMDAPVLVVVGTFHPFAARDLLDKRIASSLLTGRTALAWNADSFDDMHEQTSFVASAFLKPGSSEEVDGARQSISGLLLCAFGAGECLGVLHPYPCRRFDSALIPSVEFGEVELDRPTRRLRVFWPSEGR